MLFSFPGLQSVPIRACNIIGISIGSQRYGYSFRFPDTAVEIDWGMSAPPPVHDALTILRHSFALPMLHVLRTSPAFSSSLLPAWDNLLLSIFSNITNIDIHPGDPAWLQATLPVGSRGLGIRSACHLAPSAFLASADGASSLMLELLPVDLSTTPTWKGSLPWLPGDMSCHRTLLYLQKAWDTPRVDCLFDAILSACGDQESRARLSAASSKESGA